MANFKFKNISNWRFGKLIARHRTEKHVKGKPSIWFCECDCGGAKNVSVSELLRGTVRSCGCLLGANLRKHGYSHMREYRVWNSIKERCFNPRHPRFKDWGARGIIMCKEWCDDFTAFLQEVGKRPPKPLGFKRYWSIERIDNSKGYEPGNVKWATPKEQAHNRRIPVK